MQATEVNHDTGVVTLGDGDSTTIVQNGEKTVIPNDAPMEMPPEEEAAMKFTRLLPYVAKLGDAMPSKGGLVRVMKALAEFPLGATTPRLLNDPERQLFQIMMELQGYKSTVITSIMQKEAELKKQTAAASAPPAESEVTNG